MLEGQRVLREAYYSSKRMNFDARLVQCFCDKLSNRVSHARHNLLAHLNYQHARFTGEGADAQKHRAGDRPFLLRVPRHLHLRPRQRKLARDECLAVEN